MKFIFSTGSLYSYGLERCFDLEGAISLELEPSALNAGCSDEDMVKMLATSLAYCRDWAAD